MSKSSKIRIRLITRNANDAFDRAFWKRKVAWAWEYRKTVMGEDASCCRVLFSEADGFPGLVVDRFNDVLVAETLSVGMEQLKPVIFPVLLEVLAEDGVSIRGLYERNDVATRKLEGLELTAGWFAGTAGEDGQAGLDPLAPGAPGTEDFGPTATQIVENGVRYEVDSRTARRRAFPGPEVQPPCSGQACRGKARARLLHAHGKLRAQRRPWRRGVRERRGHLRARRGTSAQERAAQRLEERMDFTATNVFDLLPALEAAHDRTYDFIVLDPPASRKAAKPSKAPRAATRRSTTVP